MTIVLYHNPRCPKSRKTLQLIEEKGISPKIVEYLKTPPGTEELLELAELLGLRVADMVRTGETAFAEVRDSVSMDDDRALASAISENPILLQRPIVVETDAGIAVIGRPPENVLRLIE
jgi:arsenate reductase